MPTFKVIICTKIPAYTSVVVEAATQEEAENEALDAAPQLEGYETEFGGDEEYEVAGVEIISEDGKDD